MSPARNVRPRRGPSAGQRRPRSTRIALPPMTCAIAASSRPASRSASVTWTSPVASNGTGTAPSKSEPSADVVDAGDVDRVADRARDRRDVVAAAGRRPEPDADEPAGRGDPAEVRRRTGCGRCRRRPGRRCARRRPGRVAIARTSSIVAAEAWATSTSIRRASIRRTISRPASVRPPFSTPCAEPPNALSKKWLGDIIR